MQNICTKKHQWLAHIRNQHVCLPMNFDLHYNSHGDTSMQLFSEIYIYLQLNTFLKTIQHDTEHQSIKTEYYKNKRKVMS